MPILREPGPPAHQHPDPVGVRVVLRSDPNPRTYGPSPDDPGLRCTAHYEQCWLKVMGKRATEDYCVLLAVPRENVDHCEPIF